jgi:DNA gyrase subunit A
MRTIVDELRAVQRKYGDVRRSQIIEDTGEFRVEDLIAEEDMAITVSNTGYIKRTPITTYRNQRRGGKGRIGMRTREEDFVSHLFIASTHAYIMIFSDRGRAYWLKVHEIPDVGPGGKGKAIANLVLMDPDERIAALLAVKAFEFDKFIVMGTQRGVIKKTELTAFSNPRAGGIIGMGVEEGDRVMAVRMTDGQGEIFIGTRDGMAIRFPESDVRAVGRAAYGVRGINLREDDQVVAMEVVKPFDQAQGEPSGAAQERAADVATQTVAQDRPFGSVHRASSAEGSGEPGPSRTGSPEPVEARTVAQDRPVGGTLLTVTGNGYGKRTEIDEYRVQSRGGVGIINIQTTERNGRVVGIALVYDDDEVLLISQQGKILRMTARDVRTIGRATQGVRLIDIDPDDRVVSVARLAEKEEEDKNTDFDA